MMTRKGAPQAPLSKERERLLRNLERVRALTGEKIDDIAVLSDHDLARKTEDMVSRAWTAQYCGADAIQCCRVSTYLIRGSLLNYDGSIHTCRRKPERKLDLYDRTLRGLGRGRT